MNYEEAKSRCHVRSAIYRTSNKIRYWKNHSVSLDERISDEDKKADDWEEYDPRDDDNSSMFGFND